MNEREPSETKGYGGRVVWGTVLLGLGLGGFFDGIALHQVLRWYHMFTSAGYPANTVENLELNTLGDGLFHASTYAFTLIGLAFVWSAARLAVFRWSTKLLVGGSSPAGALLTSWRAPSTTTSSPSTTCARTPVSPSGTSGSSCGVRSCWSRGSC